MLQSYKLMNSFKKMKRGRVIWRRGFQKEKTPMFGVLGININNVCPKSERNMALSLSGLLDPSNMYFQNATDRTLTVMIRQCAGFTVQVNYLVGQNMIYIYWVVVKYSNAIVNVSSPTL